MRSAILTLLVVCFGIFAQAAPNVIVDFDCNANKASHDPAYSNRALQVRTGSINLAMGTLQSNVGRLELGELYDTFNQALRHACSRPHDKSCKNRMVKIPIWEGDLGISLGKYDAQLTITSASWGGNTVLYDLLIDAISGAVMRSTYLEENCYYFWADGVRWHHCNTFDWANVDLPGGHHMHVKFASKTRTGKFDCWRAKQTIEWGLYQHRGEFQHELSDSDLYENVKCVVDLV